MQLNWKDGNMQPLVIDGATGWGQVLRTAIALFSLTLKPVKVVNIRKNRPKPGLMAQHLIGVKIAGEFCNAEIRGLRLGSMEVEFIPKSFNIIDKRIDIGTAGSISLLLQTLTPLLIFADKPVTLEIVGGTAGLGAPTIEYMKYVTFPILSLLGVKIPKIEIIRQGFYPKGQGFVKIHFSPIKKLNGVQLIERGNINRIRGISIAGSLPRHVAHRQAYSAKRILVGKGYKDTDLLILNNVYTASSGTSITLFAECDKTILGSDNIGKIGVRAEQVGEECANDLIRSINSNTALDKYMADQIVPFIALANGKSEVTIEQITHHCLTNISVCEQLLGVKFEMDKINKRISVEGIGFQKM